jgi:hypothetical protein
VEEALGDDIMTDTDEGVPLEEGIADDEGTDEGTDEETRALQGLRLGNGLDVYVQ